MYINSGYLNNSRTDFKDNSTPLVVGSCGTYRLKTRPKLPTYWQKGRRDYQILYVANGKTHFWFDGREEIVSAGYMVLYKPEEIQKYVYYLEDNPEVFWIHFTGSDVKNILAYHDISLDEHVFYCGVLPDYKALFRKIIQELQLCRYGYEDYIASLFNDILLLVDRQQHEQKKATGNVQEQIERAAAYFNENYNTKISIDDYAESLHISTNWFIHNFKQYAGMSPAQYILSLRMVNAQSLLERTTYNIKEISEIVGYENPLYFSRVFKKEIGKSPAQYRKEAAFLAKTFIYGVKAFFAPEALRPQTNEKMDNLISLKDEIYRHSIDMTNAPVLDLYYVCCGKWVEGNGLMSRVNLDIQPLIDTQNFSSVAFFPYDSEKIITTYKELKKKVSRSFTMEKKVTFPPIDGVKQAFLGLVKCKDFVTILTDSRIAIIIC